MGTGSRQRRVGAALGAVALVAGASSVAAGTDDTSGDGAVAGSAPADSVEIDGSASIEIGWITPPTNLDPHRECHIGCRPYWLPIFDTLYDYVGGEVVPMLAESESYSDDGLTFTVTLQEGVEFHDGTPVNSDAVVASIERGKTVEGSTVAGTLALVEDVTAVDERTVAFELSSPRPNFQSVLSGAAGAVINPAVIADGHDIGLDPEGAGSGPFEVTDFTPNEEVTYVPFEDYWRDDRGLVGEMTIYGMPDTTTVTNAIQSDEIDLGYVRGDREQFQPIADSGYQLAVLEAPTMEAIWLRSTRNEFGNRLVRQALNYAIDRETISAEVYGGDCVASSQPFREGLPLHIPDYDPYPYDPDRARELLAGAGLPDGFSFELVTVTGNAPSELNGLLIQQYLGDIGVEVALTPMASPDGVAAFNADQLDARSTVVTNQADAAATIAYNYMPGGPQHAALGDEETLVGLMDELTAAFNDAAEYERILGEIAQEINDAAFTINICAPAAYFLANPSVQNVDGIQYQGVFDPRGLAVAAVD